MTDRMNTLSLRNVRKRKASVAKVPAPLRQLTEYVNMPGFNIGQIIEIKNDGNGTVTMVVQHPQGRLSEWTIA